MKKIFISQPMPEGMSEEDIITERQKAIDKLKDYFKGEEFEIIDSIIQEYPPADVKNHGLWYLAKSIEFLSKADVACFWEGWKNRRGCRIEYDCACRYNTPTITEREIKSLLHEENNNQEVTDVRTQ